MTRRRPATTVGAPVVTRECGRPPVPNSRGLSQPDARPIQIGPSLIDRLPGTDIWTHFPVEC
jgi:hypothetical protein